MSYTVRHFDYCDAATAHTCVTILRTLPEWFGMESSLIQYEQELTTLPTIIAEDDEQTVGFLTVKRHFPQSAEIYVMGVERSQHRMGIGRELVTACEQRLAADGVTFLQVKTLSAAHPDEYYGRTRKFYERLGFASIEELTTLWDENNPCLLMMKAIS